MRWLTLVVLLVLLIAIPTGAQNQDEWPDDPSFAPWEKGVKGSSQVDEQFDFYSFCQRNDIHQPVYKAHPFDKTMVGKPQTAGTSIDRAWSIHKGDPETVIGIVECGFVWKDIDAVYKFRLNKAELSPFPPDKNNPSRLDRNGDGKFTVEDYEPESKEFTYYKGLFKMGQMIDYAKAHYKHTEGGFNGNDKFFRIKTELQGNKRVNSIEFYNDPNGNGILDPQDLIRTFSNSIDEDNNGFIDDICGWDFFDDDNDPEDTSSIATSMGHGFEESRWTAAMTDNGYGWAGVCRECTILPVRDWDTFAADTSYYSLGALYAARNGADILLSAIGGLNNSGISRDVIRYIYNDLKVPIVSVASDMNSQNRNWPTHLNEPLFATAIIPDLYLPPLFYKGPIFFNTYFRGANSGQFTGKTQVVMEEAHGSGATGFMTGSIALMISYGKKLGLGKLHPDQYKQLLCRWAEDVIPENTKGAGVEDPVKWGWDMHTGYGRANIYRSMMALKDGKIPHVARITSPPWYAYMNPSQTMSIFGEVRPAGGKSVSWTIEAGYGMEPEKFIMIASGSSTGNEIKLADIDLKRIKSELFSNTNLSAIPSNPDPEPVWSPNIIANRNLFTLRLRVSGGGDDLTAEDRRVFYLNDDKTIHAGWPIYLGCGGEQAPRFADLDGDGLMEVVVATSDGRILIFRHDGIPFKLGNRIIEFKSKNMDMADRHSMAVNGANMAGVFTSPAVGDIDNDGIREITAACDNWLYCFKADGRTQPGFPVQFGENYFKDKEQGLVTHENFIGPGTTADAVLHDMDGDGKMEIILAAEDQRIYAWHSDGKRVKGWPVYARTDEKSGGKITHSVCIADLDGDGKKEIIATSNEIAEVDMKDKISLLLNKVSGSFKKSDIPDLNILQLLLTSVTALVGKEVHIYAIRPEGSSRNDGGRTIDRSAFRFAKPFNVMALWGDLLPQVCPSNKPTASDINGDGKDEIIVAFMTGQASIIDGKGNLINEMDELPFGKKCVGITDNTLAINAVGNPVTGDINGDGSLEIASGGVTLGFGLNQAFQGLNFNVNHVVQVWDPKTGRFFEYFPRHIDDFVHSDLILADVSGDAIPEIIAGSGLGLLHAFNSKAEDFKGFPKLSGGWHWAPSSVGDIDNDGFNEIAAVTREGYIFIWDTEGVYSKTSDWPTLGHDNFCSSNPRTDATPPASVTQIKSAEGGIQFRCPGDDGFNGTAKEIAVYGYNEPLNTDNISKATLVEKIQPIAGGKEILVKTGTASFAHYAVVARDKAGNTSQLPLFIGGSASPEESGDTDKEDSWCFISTAI